MYSNIDIQPYTVIKISIHEKWKHTSINKLFLYLFVCDFCCYIIAILMRKLFY